MVMQQMSERITTNRCKHCGGNIDLRFDADEHKWYQHCILCGREEPLVIVKEDK